jgi:hypothetical protein
MYLFFLVVVVGAVDTVENWLETKEIKPIHSG